MWSFLKSLGLIPSRLPARKKLGGVTRHSLLASLMALSLLCGGLGVASATDVVHVDENATGAVEVYTKTGVDTELGKKADKTAVEEIKNTVGDVDSGLVKKTADNATGIEVNKTNISALKETVGDDTKGLTKKINDNTAAIAMKADVTALGEYAKTADVNAQLANKADTTALDGKANTDLSNLTEAGKTAIKTTMEDELAKKADKTALNQATDRITANETAIAGLTTKTTDQQTAIDDLKKKTTQISYEDGDGTKISGVTIKDGNIVGNGNSAITQLANVETDKIKTDSINGKSLTGTTVATEKEVKDVADAVKTETDERKAADTALEEKIAKNTKDIATLDGKVTTAQGDIQTNANNIQANSKAIADTNKRTGGIARNLEDTQTTIEGSVKVDNKGNVKDVEKLSAKKITTTEDAVIGGDLKVTGETTLSGELKAEKDATFEKNVTVQKDLTVDGKLNVDKISMKNDELKNGKKHDSATTITADEISNLAKVTEQGNTIESQFTHNEKGTFNYAKDEKSTGEWKRATSNVTADGVSNKMTDSDGNTHTYYQTATESKEQLVNGDKSKSNFEKKTAEGNTISITEKDADGNLKSSLTNTQTVNGEKTSVTNEDSSSTINQGADQIRYNVTSKDENKTSSSIEVKADGITNTSDGTITNDANHIENKATTMKTTVTGKATESYGELETTVTRQATENFKGGLNTTVTGAENHTVTGKQINTVGDGQINNITGGQKNNILTGNQETTVSNGSIINNAENGDISNTAKNVTNVGTVSVTNTVGKNEVKVSTDGVDIKAEDGKKITESVGTASRVVENDKITDKAADSTVTTEKGKGTTFGKEESTGTTNIYGDSIKTGKINAEDTTTDKLTAGAAAGVDGGRLTVDAKDGVKGSYKFGDYTSRSYILDNTLKSGVDNGKEPIDADFVGSRTDHYMVGDKAKLDETVKDADGSNVTKKTSTGTVTTITDGTGTTTTKTEQGTKDITNTAKDGTITNDAKDIVTNASNSITEKVGETNVTTKTTTSSKSEIQNADTITSVQQTENMVQSFVGKKDFSTTNVTTNLVNASANAVTENGQTSTVLNNKDGLLVRNTANGKSFTTADGTNTGTALEWTNVKGNEISTGKFEANYVKMDYADVMKDLGVRGNAKIAGKTTTGSLEVTGTSTLTGKVTMESDATVGGKLDVTGKATFSDDVDIKKNLSVVGDVTANSYKVGDKTYISADGINANNQKITNVADGSISEGSKDAVNGGQLYTVKNDFEGKVNKVGANAAAMANLHPMEFDPDSKWNIAAAIGNYGSETAAALGAFYRPNDDVMVNLSTAFGTGENMVGGGVSVRLGKGGNKLSREESNALKDQVNDLTARMDALLSVLNPNMSKDFPDVPENHWAYEAVSRLAGNDIVQGYPDGEFHGERTMTRYEMAEIIYNALSRGAEAEKELVEEFKPELQAMAASEKATAEKAEG